MKIEEPVVIVIARPDVNLSNLAEYEGPLAVPCGIVGPSIAREVLEGEGRAQISISKLKIAIDTQDGVESILDNFELRDPKSGKPFLWSLVTEYLKNKK
jgi:hypothetical protein